MTQDRRLFRGEPLGATLFGLALGTTVGLLQWWTPATLAYHDGTFALGMGLVWSLHGTRIGYNRGVERRAALVFFICPSAPAFLVLH